MNAREFQQSQFFDNILVSSIRFLDALPAKTPNEKSQFLRGLPKILEQFPKSVLDKKVLPALLEETKDRELLSLILQSVFKIIQLLPSGQRALTDKVIPQLREIFISGDTKPGSAERDNAKEAGLGLVLENMALIGDNCSGKEFKEGKSSHSCFSPFTLIRYRHFTNCAPWFGVLHPLHCRQIIRLFADNIKYFRLLYDQTRAVSCRGVGIQQDWQLGDQNPWVRSFCYTLWGPFNQQS